MNGKIKKVVSALGLALLISVPSISYAKEGDYTIDDIGKTIQPPQYADKSKIPIVDEWKKSVRLQGKGGDADAILIRDNQNKVKIKKTEKDGTTPIKGVEFKIYETRENAKKETKSVGDAKSGEDGLLSFTKDVPYYGFYIREENVSDPYLLRKDAIMPFYKDNGVRFLGEISPDDMKVTSINQKKALNPDWNINKELQELVKGGTSFNENTNWLVFNDNGKEKLVSKKPLKYGISWNQLYNAGVVFDKDGVDNLDDADFTHSNYEYKSKPLQHLKDYGQGPGESKSYEPTYITVNSKKYIVRLMRAFNDSTTVHDENSWGYKKEEYNNHVKGSEWNRLILPLIEDGRYGSNTEVFVEGNMPTLANYSWWTDFGGNSSNGYWRWTQDRRKSSSAEWRVDRGSSSSDRAAAYADSGNPNLTNDYRGWLAVLERVDN